MARTRIPDGQRAEESAYRTHRETLRTMQQRMNHLAGQPGRDIHHIRVLRLQAEALTWALKQTERGTK